MDGDGCSLIITDAEWLLFQSQHIILLLYFRRGLCERYVILHD